MRFSQMTVCADLYGCPNRCLHCWLGHTPNGRMTTDDLTRIAAAFQTYTDCLEVDTWYREPDFSAEYRELWALRSALSQKVTPHFELASVWRMVRDEHYIPWLREMGVQTVQLTLFGDEETTDCYTGRRGAYRDILTSVDLLLENGILPRIQVFLYKDTISGLSHVESLVERLHWVERCEKAGGRFSLFLHQGSCEGAAEMLYERWITGEDVAKIPPLLLSYTYDHLGKTTTEEVFGLPESVWWDTLASAPVQENPVSDSPVFFVDSHFDVYPNLSAPAIWWKLGNLWEDGVERVLENYKNNRSIAQHVMTTVPLGEMVRTIGNPTSERLFTQGDYTAYVLNQFCKYHLKEGQP